MKVAVTPTRTLSYLDTYAPRVKEVKGVKMKNRKIIERARV